MGEPLVCIGAIGAPHGVRGNVRLTSFTADPEDLTTYGPLSDEGGGRRFEIVVVGRARGQMIARIAGIEDRNAAEMLKGVRLYVPRSALPQTEDEEYYHADLVGLSVFDRSGVEIGTVRALYNFGAGDVLEVIQDEGGSILVPFTRAAVPVIELEAGRVVVDPPSSSDENDGDKRSK